MSDMKPRSRQVTEGLERAAARGMLRAVGMGGIRDERAGHYRQAVPPRSNAVSLYPLRASGVGRNLFDDFAEFTLRR